jgi:hypothetical protein
MTSSLFWDITLYIIIIIIIILLLYYIYYYSYLATDVSRHSTVVVFKGHAVQDECREQPHGLREPFAAHTISKITANLSVPGILLGLLDS